MMLQDTPHLMPNFWMRYGVSELLKKSIRVGSLPNRVKKAKGLLTFPPTDQRSSKKMMLHMAADDLLKIKFTENERFID